MNISISCLHRTEIRRYRKKIIQELKSITYLDDSINYVNLSFSIEPKSTSSIKCRILAQTPKEDIEVSHYANSEIRAFNLCFEELLYLLLENRRADVNERCLKKYFPYLSIPPKFTRKASEFSEIEI